MYILQKDLHKDTTDIIPYGFEVDIIKDCSSLRKDIADVFGVIDRQGPRYVQTIEKVQFPCYSKFFSYIICFLLTIFFLLSLSPYHHIISSSTHAVYTKRIGASELSRLRIEYWRIFKQLYMISVSRTLPLLSTSITILYLRFN